MACEAKHLGEENLQLIDFSQEDDYLIDDPFRDSLEDLRLSVTFGKVNEGDSQVVEKSCHTQCESMEKKRPSFLRKSLAWDSDFFTCAGVLDPEELFLINKGFNKSESHHLSPGIRKDIRPRRVANDEYISLDRDGSHLKNSKNKLFEDVKPKIPKSSKKSKVATDIGGPGFSQANALSIKKTNICSQVKATNRSPEPYHPSPRPPKILGRAKIISTRQPNQVPIEAANNVKMENKTRKAGSAPDLTVSKRSRRGDLSGLPKSTPFTPTTKKQIKTYCSYDSSSSASSSKSIRRKINPRNTKLSASPLIHSSSTSPASSTDGWSESLSLTSIESQNRASSSYRRGTCSVDKAIQASDLQSRPQAPSFFPCRRIEEGKFTSQCATRASIGTIPFPEGPKRKIIPSGLRMPSPKIGFFDEDQPLRNIRGSMQVHFGGQSRLTNENRSNESQPSNLTPSMDTKNCSKVGIFFNEENNRRKVCGSSSRIFKPDGQRSKVTSKNNMSIERKRPKDNGGSFQQHKKKQNEVEDGQKENVCSFEDQVNGLTKFLEVIDLDKDVVAEVKGQRSCFEPITPCSRTPLAETKFWKR